MINRLLVILSILCLSPLQAQDEAVADSLLTDNAPIKMTDFEPDFQDKYADSDFNYEEGRTGSGNFISRMVNAFLSWLQEVFGVEIDPDTYELIETILYILLIAVGLYFMVRLLLGQKAVALFGGDNTALAPLRTQEEDLSQIDLQALINQALKQSDYRLAVRYMFLKVLKELSGKKLIEWHYEKTNNDYLKELKSPGLKHDFKTVSHLYDYIWYGEFPINEERFLMAQAQFDHLEKTIKKSG